MYMADASGQTELDAMIALGKSTPLNYAIKVLAKTHAKKNPGEPDEISPLSKRGLLSVLSVQFSCFWYPTSTALARTTDV
jgi:hypothetical protein